MYLYCASFEQTMYHTVRRYGEMSGMDMYHCKPTPTPEKENI